MKKKPDISRLGPLASQGVAYFLILAFFAIYLFSGALLFGFLAGLALVWAVALEFLLGAHEHGWHHELRETAIAVVLAVVVWFGSGFVLQTPSPLNAIVSCSMLPNVQRGDMVVLSGDRLNAPQEDVGTLAGMGYDAEVYHSGIKVGVVKGSLMSHCAQNANPMCEDFANHPGEYSEKRGPLAFGYAACGLYFPKTGARAEIACVQWLEVNGKRFYENTSNDVAVYAPEKDEYYARVGDIIHRAFIRLEADGKVYFLTKGDNNPVFDIQVYDEKSGMGNRPVELSRSKGRVLFSIPYVGYFKLFLSPAALIHGEGGCDRYYAKYAAS